jgi:tRNA (cmo5U34)-methyltransferase
MKDKVFTEAIEKKFEFDQAVASVFDDMLDRSIPFYNEVQQLIINIILAEEADGLRVIDLGSSTAQFLLELYANMTTDMDLVGIDNSEAMLEHAKQKAKAFGADIKLEFGDVLTYDYNRCNFAISNYTLQFIRPMQRLELTKSIFDALESNGLFIFSEKVIFDDKRLDKEMIDIYYDFKRARGYSEFEISQKREALENILVPFTIKENIEMCQNAGFTDVQTVFQWANFVTFIARKQP